MRSIPTIFAQSDCAFHVYVKKMIRAAAGDFHLSGRDSSSGSADRLLPEFKLQPPSAHSSQNFLTGKNRNLGYSGKIQTGWSARCLGTLSLIARLLRGQAAFRHQISGLRCAMLPCWIELSSSDLMQGTAFLVTLATIFSLQFLLPTGRV